MIFFQYFRFLDKKIFRLLFKVRRARALTTKNNMFNKLILSEVNDIRKDIELFSYYQKQWIKLMIYTK